MFTELVRKTRSYRRFYEDVPVRRETLLEIVDCARLSASGGNRQALRYFIAADAATCAKIYPTLTWAMMLKDWDGPEPGERPAAYIVMGQDEGYKSISPADPGIVAQTMMLAATEKGLGGCMFSGIRRDELKASLGLPDTFEVLMVLALGKTRETVVVDEVEPDADLRYWRDADRVHHVPKRKLKDIVLNW